MALLNLKARHEQEKEVEQEDVPVEVQSDVKEEEAPQEDVVEEIDPAVAAEKAKEEGNAAFKAGRYQEAIEQYSKAIGMWSLIQQPLLRMWRIGTLVQFVN